MYFFKRQLVCSATFEIRSYLLFISSSSSDRSAADAASNLSITGGEILPAPEDSDPDSPMDDAQWTNAQSRAIQEGQTGHACRLTNSFVTTLVAAKIFWS